MAMRGIGIWLAIVGTPFVAGCGHDDPAPADLSGQAEVRPPAEASAKLAATDPGTISESLADLLETYDGARNRIVADPSIAADHDDPAVADFLAAFEPGSDFAQQVLDYWAEQGAVGWSLEPLSAEYPALAMRLDGDVELVGEAEVRFPWCEMHSYKEVGVSTTNPPGETGFQAGTGVAVLVDGQWRLRRTETIEQLVSCRTQAGGGW